MIKPILVLAFIFLPGLSLAAEDTHGVLIDRGIARTSTGRADLPTPADAQKPAATDSTADKTKDANQNKTDSAADDSDTTSKPKHKQTQAEFTHSYASKSSDFYRKLHRNPASTSTHVQN